MTTFVKLDDKLVEIEEPEINKMYSELTRLIAIAGYWDNKPMAMLLKICLKARNRHKMIYGHPKNAVGKEKDFNTFYSDTFESKENGYSIFITSVSVLINDKEVTPPEAYKRLVMTGMCSFKKNNPFGVIREGNFFSGYTYKIRK